MILNQVLILIDLSLWNREQVMLILKYTFHQFRAFVKYYQVNQEWPYKFSL